MEHLLFAGYLVLFAWLVTKVKFFTRTGLTHSQLIILFLIKVMAGIIYGWIGVYYGQMAQMIDTWFYQHQSMMEYQLLLHHPIDFFTSIFHNSYQEGYSKFLTSENSWWNDLKSNSFIKLLALFNVFSFGNYYINVIFYSFLSLFGPIAIYRVMQDVFPTRKIPVLLASFLVPSFLYWTSGLHKEGIIFIGLALIIYHLYFGFREKRFSLLRLLSILLGFVIVLALRNFLVITLVPAIVAWALAEKTRFKPSYVFGLVGLLFILLFFTARYLVPQLDFPQAVVKKQHEFLIMGGNSAVSVNKLEPTFTSFLINAPQALSMSAVRPFPSDVRHLLSLAAAMEINFLLILFFVFLIWRRKGDRSSNFLLFCLFFSFAVLMMVGYSVNILGAIVRYRSIIFPFLLVPMFARIDWQRIQKLVLGNM